MARAGHVLVQRMEHLDRILDLDNRDAVPWTHDGGETDRCLLHGGDLVAHAGRAVEQQREVDWSGHDGEQRDVLWDAVLEDGKVRARQTADEVSLWIRHDDIESDEIDAAVKTA